MRYPPGAICLLACLIAQPAAAQYGAQPARDPATGERYHIEFTAGFWSPTPEMLISSESLNIPGSTIDLVTDFGITKERFRDLRLVLRPARKHKFRFSYLPIKYDAETLITRELVFNGQKYTVGLPVNASLDWKAYRIGYEYDFIYRNRGFLGFIAEAKYTDVHVSLTSPLAGEFAQARAPIPALGGIGRVYVVSNVALTFEVTGFKLPESLDERYRAKYIEIDFYGTFNFTNNGGVQAGYRSINVLYRVDEDFGDFTLKGPYVAGVVRF